MDAFATFEADAVIAEAYQGGELVRAVLSQADGNAPVKLVRATRGKITRAAPYAAMYEAGRVHHVGCFPELEDQMCHYDAQSSWGKSGNSPGRKPLKRSSVTMAGCRRRPSTWRRPSWAR